VLRAGEVQVCETEDPGSRPRPAPAETAERRDVRVKDALVERPRITS